MEQQYFVNILQLIDISTERGAWKGVEIESIAMLRKQTMEQIQKMAEESEKEKSNKEESQLESVTKKIGEK
tara:strand:- start:227 stop:439 length:213 start_codon:yes stop_codon:yes gene_type:complete